MAESGPQGARPTVSPLPNYPPEPPAEPMSSKPCRVRPLLRGTRLPCINMGNEEGWYHALAEQARRPFIYPYLTLPKWEGKEG